MPDAYWLIGASVKQRHESAVQVGGDICRGTAGHGNAGPSLSQGFVSDYQPSVRSRCEGPNVELQWNYLTAASTVATTTGGPANVSRGGRQILDPSCFRDIQHIDLHTRAAENLRQISNRRVLGCRRRVLKP